MVRISLTVHEPHIEKLKGLLNIEEEMVEMLAVQDLAQIDVDAIIKRLDDIKDSYPLDKFTLGQHRRVLEIVGDLSRLGLEISDTDPMFEQFEALRTFAKKRFTYYRDQQGFENGLDLWKSVLRYRSVLAKIPHKLCYLAANHSEMMLLKPTLVLTPEQQAAYENCNQMTDADEFNQLTNIKKRVTDELRFYCLRMESVEADFFDELDIVDSHIERIFREFVPIQAAWSCTLLKNLQMSAAFNAAHGGVYVATEISPMDPISGYTTANAVVASAEEVVAEAVPTEEVLSGGVPSPMDNVPTPMDVVPTPMDVVPTPMDDVEIVAKSPKVEHSHCESLSSIGTNVTVIRTQKDDETVQEDGKLNAFVQLVKDDLADFIVSDHALTRYNFSKFLLQARPSGQPEESHSHDFSQVLQGLDKDLSPTPKTISEMNPTQIITATTRVGGDMNFAQNVDVSQPDSAPSLLTNSLPIPCVKQECRSPESESSTTSDVEFVPNEPDLPIQIDSSTQNILTDLITPQVGGGATPTDEYLTTGIPSMFGDILTESQTSTSLEDLKPSAVWMIQPQSSPVADSEVQIIETIETPPIYIESDSEDLLTNLMSNDVACLMNKATNNPSPELKSIEPLTESNANKSAAKSPIHSTSQSYASKSSNQSPTDSQNSKHEFVEPGTHVAPLSTSNVAQCKKACKRTYFENELEKTQIIQHKFSPLDSIQLIATTSSKNQPIAPPLPDNKHRRRGQLHKPTASVDQTEEYSIEDASIIEPMQSDTDERDFMYKSQPIPQPEKLKSPYTRLDQSSTTSKTDPAFSAEPQRQVNTNRRILPQTVAQEPILFSAHPLAIAAQPSMPFATIVSATSSTTNLNRSKAFLKFASIAEASIACSPYDSLHFSVRFVGQLHMEELDEPSVRILLQLPSDRLWNTIRRIFICQSHFTYDSIEPTQKLWRRPLVEQLIYLLIKSRSFMRDGIGITQDPCERRSRAVRLMDMSDEPSGDRPETLDDAVSASLRACLAKNRVSLGLS